MAQFLTPALMQLMKSDASPYSGGKLYIYQTGTTTELSLFSDEALSTAAANPLVADASGIFPDVYIAEEKFKAVFKDADDVTVKTVDPAYSIGLRSEITAAEVSFDGSSIGFSADDVQEAIEEANSTYAALSGADFTGTSSITQNTTGTYLRIQADENSAASAGDLEFYRNSASPAASDVISSVLFYGEDSAGNKDLYGRIRGIINDPTSGSEDGVVSVSTSVAGTMATRVNVGGGFYTQGVTGGDKGAGTVNAETLYQAGTALADSPLTVKAWVTFSGTTGVVRNGHNVSSVTRHATGDYTINFTNDLPSANYAIVGMSQESQTDVPRVVSIKDGETPAVGSCRITLRAVSDQSLTDALFVNVIVFS